MSARRRRFDFRHGALDRGKRDRRGRGHRTRSHSFRGSSAVERLVVNQRPRRFDPCPRSFLRERGRRPPAGLIRRPCLVRLQGSRLSATAPSANGQAARPSTWRSEFDPPWSHSVERVRPSRSIPATPCDRRPTAGHLASNQTLRVRFSPVALLSTGALECVEHALPVSRHTRGSTLPKGSPTRL